MGFSGSHNPKVVGSNPASATTKNLAGTLLARFSIFLEHNTKP